jgi:hypothetical protein
MSGDLMGNSTGSASQQATLIHPLVWVLGATVVSFLLLNNIDAGESSIQDSWPWFAGLFVVQLIGFIAADSFAAGCLSLGWREALFAWVAAIGYWLLWLPEINASSNYQPDMSSDYGPMALMLRSPLVILAATLAVGYRFYQLRKWRLIGYGAIAVITSGALGLAVFICAMYVSMATHGDR